MINYWVFWSRKKDQIWNKKKRDWSWKVPLIRKNCTKSNKRFFRCYRLTRTSLWTVRPFRFSLPQSRNQLKSKRSSKLPPSLKRTLMPLVKNISQYHSRLHAYSLQFLIWETLILCTSIHWLITLSYSPKVSLSRTNHQIYQSDLKTLRPSSCTPFTQIFVDLYLRKTNFCFHFYSRPDWLSLKDKLPWRWWDSYWQGVLLLMIMSHKNQKIAIGSVLEVGDKYTGYHLSENSASS